MQEWEQNLQDDTRTTRSITLAALSLKEPTTSDRSIWDERLRRLLRLQAMAIADRRFGNLARAYHEHGLADIARGRSPNGQRLRAATEEQESYYAEAARVTELAEAAREHALIAPYDAAVRELVFTPAPDFFGARFKIELIAEEELHLMTSWEEVDLMQIVADDMTRLTKAEIGFDLAGH